MFAGLIAVVGPTGTGKSELGLRIATALAAAGQSAEIINCDSMQLYRGMDIGTAKLPPSERCGITHHLLDTLEIQQDASVAEYQQSARAIAIQLLQAGTIPILVGGSMLYAYSVIGDYEFPGTDPSIRARLEAELEQFGSEALHARVAEVDAAAAARLDPHNPRRIVRALEIIELAGGDYTGALPDFDKNWLPTLIIGLRPVEATLNQRLESRVRGMWRQGMLTEVQALLERGLRTAVTAGKAIGYRQAIAQLDGELTEEEAITETTNLTRRYVRRQMTWYRRDRNINWYDSGDEEQLRQAVSRATNWVLAGADNRAGETGGAEGVLENIENVAVTTGAGQPSRDRG